MLWVGLGCGGLLLLSIIGSVVSYWYVRSQAQAALDQASALQGNAEAVAAAAVAAAAVAGATTAVTLDPTGECTKAYACCVSIATKNGGATAATVCEAFKHPSQNGAACAAQMINYREVAKAIGVTCD
jgi:hypothetical protein